MGDSELAEELERLPGAAEERVVEPVRPQGRERRCFPPEDEQRVVVDRRGRRHHLARREARVAGEQGHERLALRGVQAAPSPRQSAAAVPDRAPERGDDLGVVGVAAVDLHQQRAPVVVDASNVEDAADLALVHDERSGANAELGERRRDVAETRPTCRRAEREPDPGGGGDPDQHRGDRSGRRADPHHRSTEHAEGDDPATEPAQRTDDERREGDDHGGGLGDPNVRKERCLARATERTVEVGPRADREPRRAQSHERGDEHRRHRLPDHSESSAYERRGQQREREEPQQVGAEPHRRDRATPGSW